MHRHMGGLGALSLAVLMSLSSGASGELALSANDGKAVLVDGVNAVPANPPADSVTVIDLNATPPKVVAFGLGALLLGVVCFGAWSWKGQTWPFEARPHLRRS